MRSCIVWSPRSDRAFPGDAESVRDVNPPVSCGPPNLEETKRGMNQLESGEAPGECGIYAEMLSAGESPPFCGCTL